MRSLFETSGPRIFGSRAMLPLFAAGAHVHNIDDNPRHTSEKAATVDAGDVQLSPRTSLVVADLYQVAERLDSVAGSEFVDDRIRLRE